MARVVCQVLPRSDRLTLIWSEGSASFPPYTIKEAAFAELKRLAGQAQDQLTQLGAAADDTTKSARVGHQLAQVGHALYRLIFQLDQPGGAAGQEVRQWLAGITVDALELVGNVLTVPWTILYDQTPDQAAFAKGGAEAEGWRGFWGQRYPLTGGPRVQWLRGRALPARPALVLAIDPGLRAALPPEEQKRLADFIAANAPAVAESQAALLDLFQSQAVDLLYVCGRAEQGAMRLGEDRLSAEVLEKVVFADREEGTDSEDEDRQTLVMLNPCQVGGETGPNLLRPFERFAGVGLIGAWQPVAGAVANRCGLELLQQLLAGGKPLAQALEAVRRHHPAAGALYFACCPADLRTRAEDGEPASQTAAGEPLPLPDSPYQPLLSLDETTAPFLVGRDNDIAVASSLLDDGETRMLLVHGAPGVGKSSLLHAGVVPFLEDRCVGYRVMRERSAEGEAPASELDYPLMTVRGTSDLAGQLALALLDFCDRPLSYTTPTGRTITVDLAALLGSVVHGSPATAGSTGIQEGAASAAAPVSGEELRLALRREPDLLGRVLEALTGPLPFELVLVIEQADELFSLIPPGSDGESTGIAVTMLRAALASAARAKFIVSLRTEYFGRFVSLLVQTPDDLHFSRNFLVRELSEDELVEVILQPTSVEALPGTDEAPQLQYRFQYEQGLAETIARDARRLGSANQESPLALIHAVCARLWKIATAREERVIRAADVKGVEGLEKGLSRYVDFLLKAVPSSQDRKALRKLLLQLFIRQPDGSLTRDLVAQEKLQEQWRGSTPLEVAVASAAVDSFRLLDVGWLNVGGREGNYVSLGHDVLAPVAAQRAEEATKRSYGWSRMADALWITIPLLILLGTFTVMGIRGHAAREGKMEEELKEWAKHAEDQGKAAKSLLERTEAMNFPTYLGEINAANQALLAGNLVRVRQALVALKPIPNRTEDLRGFEWYWLLGQMHQDQATFVNHHALITGVALTPDGGLLATCSVDGTVRLWHPGRNEELFKLEPRDKNTPAPAQCVAFSADGSLLAAGGDEGTVRVWKINRPGFDHPLGAASLLGTLFPTDAGALAPLCQLAVRGLVDGKPVAQGELSDHQGAVLAVAFSPDGKTLASAGKDGAVKLWDLTSSTPKVRETLKEHSGPVLSVAFSPDGKWLASGGTDKLIHVWDAATGKKQETLKGHPQDVTAVAWSYDSKTLASGGAQSLHGLESGLIKLWDAGTWKERTAPSFAVAPIFALSFTRNGKTLVTAAKDNAVQFWDIEKGTERAALKGHLGWVRSLAVANGGLVVASGSYDGSAKIWQPKLIATRDLLKVSSQPVLTVAFSPDDLRLATGSADGAVKVFDVLTGRETQVFKGHKAAVQVVVWGEGGKKLASGSADGVVKIWDLDAKSRTFGNELDSVQAHDKEVTCLSFVGKGTRLITCSTDGSAKVWKLEGEKTDKDKDKESAAVKLGQKPLVVKLDSAIYCLGVIDDFSVALTGHDDGKIRLWDFDTGKATLRGKSSVFTGHTGRVTCLAFLEGRGLLVLTGSSDQTIKAWDINAGTEVYTLRSNSGTITALSSNLRDPLTFVVGSTDKTVRLCGPTSWATTKIALADRFILPGSPGVVRSVAYGNSTNYVAAAGEDGTVRIWRAADPDGRVK